MAFVSWLSISRQLDGFSWPQSSFMVHKRAWIELEFRAENNAARTREEAIFNYFWLQHIEPMKAFFPPFFYMISFPGDYMLRVTKAYLCWLILENHCWWKIMVALSILVLLENSGLLSTWHYCPTHLLKKLKDKAWALALAKSPLFHGLSHQEALGWSLQCTNCHYLLLKHADWLLPASRGSGGVFCHLLMLFLFVFIADILNLVYSICHTITHSSGTLCLRSEKGWKVYILTYVFVAKSLFSFIPVLLLCVALSLLTKNCP